MLPSSSASPSVDGEEASAVSSTQSHKTQSADDSWEWGASRHCRLSAQFAQTLDEPQRDVGGFESDDSMKLQTVTTSKKSEARPTRQRGLARAQRDLLRTQAKHKKKGSGLAILKQARRRRKQHKLHLG